MAGCSVFLELDQAQLDVVRRVLGSACPVVQPTPAHLNGPVLLYGMFPPGKGSGGVHAMYAVEIPEKPGQVRIHFTDVQKSQLKCAGVNVCDYIEVESIGLKYGIVMPSVMRYAMPTPPPGAPE